MDSCDTFQFLAWMPVSYKGFHHAVFWMLTSLAIHASKLNLTPLGIQEYCMLWHNENKLFLASKFQLYVISFGNGTQVFRALEWPHSNGMFSTRKQGSCSILLSTIELYPDLYEVCGVSNGAVRCQLHLDKGGTWHWLQSMEVSHQTDYTNVIFNYHDGHFIVAYSNSGDQTAVMQLRTAVPRFRLLTTENVNSMNTDSVNTTPDQRWWRNYIETSNHRYLHFVPGVRLHFHGFAVIPGKRYVVFSEVAKEVVNKATWWSEEQNEVVYTRIARVCTGDPGFHMSAIDPNYFTSFFKARLVCRVRGSRLSTGRTSIPYTPDIEFNHLVAFTQMHSSSQGTADSILYGLFSLVDPSSSVEHHIQSVGPMALCSYRLSDIDRVFRTSDLIQILPQQLDSNSTSLLLNMTNFTTSADASHAYLPYWGSRNAFRRIRRVQDAGTATMTDCPAPSRSYRRLAMEFPLLADPVLPADGDALALLNLPTRISTIKVDPRFVNRLMKREWLDSLSSVERVISTTVFFLGSDNGAVYKLIVSKATTTNRETIGKTHTKLRPNHSNNSFQRFQNQSTAIYRLHQSTSEKGIQSILLLHTDMLTGKKTVISEHSETRVDMDSRIELILVDGKEILTIETHDCASATKCEECVALKDPQCYWSLETNKCNTEISSLNDLLMGTHSRCAEVTPPIETTTTTTSSIKQITTTELEQQKISTTHKTASFETILQPLYPRGHIIENAPTAPWILVLSIVLAFLLGIVSTWLIIRCRRRLSRKQPSVYSPTTNVSKQLLVRPADAESEHLSPCRFQEVPIESGCRINNNLVQSYYTPQSTEDTHFHQFVGQEDILLQSPASVYRGCCRPQGYKLTTFSFNNNLPTSMDEAHVKSEDETFQLSVHS